MPRAESVLCKAPRYRDPEHAELSHVVKMSGGRSSAAMALSLARVGALRPERGDLALFANTTCEHPATYDFAVRVCDELEDAHGVPCFWYEFCTVEDVSARGGWSRHASWRLVRRRPAEPGDDPALPGYRSDGSAFESLASHKTMLPNRHLRICTRELKTLPGAALIAEWLAGGPGPAHAGHHHGRRLTSAEQAADKYSGTMPRERFIDLHEACHRIDPESRPAQTWQKFTTVRLNRTDNGPRRRADIAGTAGRPVRYVSLLGLRVDEPDRVASMEHRAFMAEGAATAACRDSSQPAGEMPYAPLSDHGASVGDVAAFWASQPYDLGIDGSLGNCVYCFMKGEAALRRLAAAPDEHRRPGGPTHIGWWSEIENRYARDSVTDRLGGNGRFKFLSLSSVSYADILTGRRPTPTIPPPRSSAPRLPCECSD